MSELARIRENARAHVAHLRELRSWSEDDWANLCPDIAFDSALAAVRRCVEEVRSTEGYDDMSGGQALQCALFAIVGVFPEVGNPEARDA